MAASRVVCSLIGVLSMTAMGCTTIGTLQRANTMGKGAIQFSAEPLVWGYGGKGPITQPSIGLAGRYGVTDNIDVGLHVSSGGFEALGKFQLTPPTAPVIISIAPALGGFGFIGSVAAFASLSSTGWINAQIPVLIGIPLGAHQLVIAPKIQEFVLFGKGDAPPVVGVTAVGASVGCAFRLTDSIQLMPELAVAYPFLGTLGSASTRTDAAVLRPNGIVYQAALGVLFGGK